MEPNTFNFREVAQENTTLCKLMIDREKLSTDDVVKSGPLTIVAFDFAPKFDKEGKPVIDTDTGEVDNYGVVVFNELPDKYYCVGTVFTKTCRAWAMAFKGDCQLASKALAESGGVKVKFTEGKTRGGNNLVRVSVL